MARAWGLIECISGEMFCSREIAKSKSVIDDMFRANRPVDIMSGVFRVTLPWSIRF